MRRLDPSYYVFLVVAALVTAACGSSSVYRVDSKFTPEPRSDGPVRAQARALGPSITPTFFVRSSQMGLLVNSASDVREVVLFADGACPIAQRDLGVRLGFDGRLDRQEELGKIP